MAGAALAKLLVFGPRTRVVGPPEEFFVSLDTTRFECLHILQDFAERGMLDVCCSFRNGPLGVGSHALTQLCLSVSSSFPLGLIILHETGCLLQTTFMRPLSFVSLSSTGKLLYFDGAQRTLCRAMLQLDDCWIGCAQPTAGTCVTHEVLIQEHVPSCPKTCSRVLQSVLGGASSIAARHRLDAVVEANSIHPLGNVAREVAVQPRTLLTEARPLFIALSQLSLHSRCTERLRLPIVAGLVVQVCLGRVSLAVLQEAQTCPRKSASPSIPSLELPMKKTCHRKCTAHQKILTMGF